MPRVKTNEKRAHSTLKAAPTHNLAIKNQNQNYGPGPTSGQKLKNVGITNQNKDFNNAQFNNYLNQHQFESPLVADNIQQMIHKRSESVTN